MYLLLVFVTVVVCTSAIDFLRRLFSSMTNYMSSGTLNSLANPSTYGKCLNVVCQVTYVTNFLVSVSWSMVHVCGVIITGK